jgi:hypothetical protein
MKPYQGTREGKTGGVQQREGREISRTRGATHDSTETGGPFELSHEP